VIFFTGFALLLSILWFLVFVPSHSFEKGTVVFVKPGTSLIDIGNELASKNIIKSPFIFLVLSRISGYDTSLQPGLYLFSVAPTPLSVVRKIGTGDYGISPIRVTFFEGMTSFDITRVLEEKLPGFSKETFLSLATAQEGYLFPDTYFISPGTENQYIIDRLKMRFDEQIKTIEQLVDVSEKSENEIVIMASLLEREARGLADKQMIAGILYNRLDIDQRLQVDAVFGYIQKQNGYTPTRKDLESDHPYNTYKFKGLPPGPISNPGLESLLAAVTPTKTSYFYYLTGNDGLMYYGKTFEDHKRNRALYLD